MDRLPANRHSRKPEPVPSFASFEDMGLKEAVLKGVYEYGFNKPSAIQQKAIVPILKGRDVVVQSQSGTGKTGVFAIAALQKVSVETNSPQVLILSNTRELAQQTEKVVAAIGVHTAVKVHSVTGGRSLQEDIDKLQSGVHVVSGTPGRVYDMINRKVLLTKEVKLLILDEADEMLGSNFRLQVYDIYKLLPPVQFVVVSATIPQAVLEMTQRFMSQPLTILVQRDELTLEGIRQFYVNVDREAYKFETLCDLYSTLVIAQAVIFVNSKEKAEEVAKGMREQNYTVGCIHGGLSQKDRERATKEFREGVFRILVATDLWGRGLDVQQVSLVINYELPRDKEQYIHRIGRSGRFAQKGVAINFVTVEDMWKLADLEQHFSTQIDEMPAQIDAFLT